MNIIVFTKRSGTSGCVHLTRWKAVAVVAAFVTVVPALALLAGMQLGQSQARSHLLPEEWERELVRNRVEVTQAARQAREDINALAVRLGQLQAQAVRLNALGERLVELADLDSEEFGFDHLPAQGGPEAAAETTRQIEVPDFIQSLDRLAAEMDDREQRLRVLESFFMSQNLEHEIQPAGRPIRSGWVSSYYGMRTDPFTGLREHHKGVDLAGKDGSGIHAVASGVVTWSGDRYGYGQMVEINHGNGYITRYAHNKENLVEVGDVVTRGQRIARMGSSGRSTGPHVHFEVLKNGRVVNPANYLRAAR